jgi:pimeloyl-ACP methyl ester carboxylesterase
MSDRRIDIGGLRLAVRERGSGHPLLLVNGLGGNVDMWGPAQDRLALGARTIAFDAPGTGSSQTARVPMPIPAVARLVVRLLDELGLERTDVLGYSWGGLLAQQLAATAPDRVRRLALAGTSCGWGGVPGDLRALALLTTPLRYYSQTFYEATSHLLDGTGGSGGQDGHSRAHADARRAHPPSLRGYWSQVLAGTAYSSLPWLHRISAPTLIVSGLCDRLVPPANGVVLAREIANSRLVLVPGEGHLLLFDPKSAALPALAEFFADGEDSPTWREADAVRDDRAVADAVRRSRGGQPYKAVSGWFRRVVLAGR